MARKSLRPHLNQIRTWVRQGRTDAWVAHQLEVTVQQIEAFKRENELLPDGEAGAEPTGTDFDAEVDLRAEDDALIAAELEAEAARRAEEGVEEDAPESEDEDGAPKRRRGRRGGRGRSRARKAASFEGTFDHGDEGYGLWLDPAVAEDGVYAEHWAGHRGVEVVIEPDQIVIRRAGEPAADDDGDGDPA
jgi:hypothetical protein